MFPLNILLITGPLLPQPGNNANLLSKLIPHLRQKHIVHLLAPAPTRHGSLPDTVFGVPVHWAADDRHSFRRRLVYPAVSKLTDPHGYSDAIQVMLLLDAAKKLRREYPFDAAISTIEPFPAGCSCAKLPNCKKILYLMDPPACTYDDSAMTPYRRRMLKQVLAKHDCILTTPFIRAALREQGYGQFDNQVIPVGFPMLEAHPRPPHADTSKIDLLFCGWLCSGIRSPRYFLDIVERLDERFRVTFMGKECELLTQRFDIQTKAEIKTLPQQPYEVALQAMADADILINIGNSVGVHMPSKTLEYINTGKPMVNFYKLPGCPTLYYTQRYPLCLNLYEGDADLNKAAEQFVRFCEQTRGQTVDRTHMEREFADCTPEYIAQQILDKLGDRHD